MLAKCEEMAFTNHPKSDRSLLNRFKRSFGERLDDAEYHIQDHHHRLQDLEDAVVKLANELAELKKQPRITTRVQHFKRGHWDKLIQEKVADMDEFNFGVTVQLNTAEEAISFRNAIHAHAGKTGKGFKTLYIPGATKLTFYRVK